jgi:FkbM family methyltransferase
MRITGEESVQLVRIRDDAFGYADLSDGFLRLIVIDGAFEPDFFRVADALLAHGGPVADVGANHGLLSFGLAHAHAHHTDFHLFEPNATLIRTIDKTRQRYPSMTCTVNATAVSRRTGAVSFHVNPGQTGASHIVASGGDEVPSITLDDYLREKGIAHLALLKLDVEGYEADVLAGAAASLARRDIHAIYFEYFEKFLARVEPPAHPVELLRSFEYEVCFCRTNDLSDHGPATHMIRPGIAGAGLPLLPVAGHDLPPMTDLLAVPRENVVALE